MGGLGGMGGMGGMGALGGLGASGASPASTGLASQNPRELYKNQLAQIKDMGFYDEEKALIALQATNGNVDAAVERLLSS
jgi:ubiquilin